MMLRPTNGVQNRCRPRQEICRAACRHEPRRASAHAKPAAFRLLDEDHADKQGSNQRLNDRKKNEEGHARLPEMGLKWA